MITFYDFGEVVGAGTDPHWSSVSILVGSEVISGGNPQDEGPNALGSMTLFGSARTTTSPIQGTEALYRTATNGNITRPDNALFELGGSNFTIDLLAKWNSTSISAAQYHYLMAKWNTSSNRQWAFLRSGDNNNLAFWTNPTGAGTTVTYTPVGTWTPVADQVYHLACDYDGSKIRIYRDGTCILAQTATLSIFNGNANLSMFGNHAGTGNWPTGTGNQIDEWRLTKGVARYANDSGHDVSISDRAKQFGWPRTS